ncbi:MAG: hypothetical protein NVSMB1_10810 [Polyangiales bacterium]
MGGWVAVANAMAVALASKRLAVPAGTRGVMVRVSVVAAMKLPSGAGKGVEIAEGPAEPIDPKDRTPPGVVPDWNRILGFKLPTGNLNGKFDLSDIGAKRRRVVSVAVLEERVL